MKRSIVFLIILGSLVWLLFSFLSKQQSTVYTEIISPLSGSMENMGLLKKESPIGKAVESITQQRRGTYTIFYKDMKSGERYEKNSHLKFQSASLYKLWVMGELFRQIDKGTLTKEEILKESVENLNKKFGIASESAELHEGDIELSVEDALEQMITVSDNYAALLLSSRLRLSNVANFLTVNDLDDSSIGVPPMTSAHDIGILFEKLYKGEVIGQIYSKEMLAILQRQQINDRLPKYLPKGVLTAHKTGELDGYKHDGGIIYAKNGPYILVILSKSENEQYAAETIALISKAIYEVREKNTQ
jgi:beta-lactamase class A